MIPSKSEQVSDVNVEGRKQKGSLYRFPSGNVYRYDPDAPEAKDENPLNAPKPWVLHELVNPERTPARSPGRDRVH